MKSLMPNCSSSPRIWWLMADGLSARSRAARRKAQLRGGALEGEQRGQRRDRSAAGRAPMDEFHSSQVMKSLLLERQFVLQIRPTAQYHSPLGNSALAIFEPLDAPNHWRPLAAGRRSLCRAAGRGGRKPADRRRSRRWPASATGARRSRPPPGSCGRRRWRICAREISVVMRKAAASASIDNTLWPSARTRPAPPCA